jgi:ATP-dependent Clp protease, protease subunit
MLTVNAKTGEIYIDDVIGQDWFGEGITAKSISNALDQLNGVRATVRIKSPGGSADEGIAIYNTLKRYPGGVDTVNDALAASAASIVFLAGQTRTMLSGSRIMIHKAMTIEAGNADVLRKTADTLEAYDRSLVEIYSQYTSKTSDEIMTLLSAETWYNTQEAVDIGFATIVDTQNKATKPPTANWFRNAPKAFYEEPQNQSFRFDYDKAVAARKMLKCQITK